MMPDQERKLRILFLPKWYPNRYDPMPGLFIRRQAEALTGHCEVAVVYIHPDPSCPNKVEVDVSTENEVRVMRVYYKVEPARTLPGKFLAMWRYYRTAMKAIHSIREFRPDLVHAHILTRIGLIGWRAAVKMKAPLVISEHWSRYFPENGTYRGWFRKRITAFIAGKAAALVAVSGHLREAMQRSGVNNRNFRIVPNIAEPSLFRLRAGEPQDPVRCMVHVSCFEDRSKNISGFLRSIKELESRRQDFRCLMVGDGPDWLDMKEYAGFLKISPGTVTFTGIKTGPELADLFAGADFSVLSSRYETFGTVLVESLSCGVPVVSTRVGIAPEIITENNGMLVNPGDEEAMTLALGRMLDRCREYDRKAIAAGVADRFSNETVGSQILEIYREIIFVPSQ